MLDFNNGEIASKMSLDISGYRTGMLQATSIAQLFPSVVSNFIANPLLGAVSAAERMASGVVSAVSKITEVVARQGNLADNLGEMAQSAGVSSRWLSAVGRVAEDSGASLDDLAVSVGFLNKRVADLIAGDDSAAKTFDRLGVSVRGSNGELKSAEQLFGDVSTAIRALPDQYAKTAYAQDLFGRGGKSMIAFLNMGGEAIDHSARKYEAYGVAIDDATAKSGDAFARMGTFVKAAMDGIELELARPVLEVLTTHEAELMQGLRSLSRSARAVIGLTMDEIRQALNLGDTGTLLGWITRAEVWISENAVKIRSSIKEIVEEINHLWDKAKSLGAWVADHAGDIGKLFSAGKVVAEILLIQQGVQGLARAYKSVIQEANLAREAMSAGAAASALSKATAIASLVPAFVPAVTSGMISPPLMKPRAETVLSDGWIKSAMALEKIPKLPEQANTAVEKMIASAGGIGNRIGESAGSTLMRSVASVGEKIGSRAVDLIGKINLSAAVGKIGTGLAIGTTVGAAAKFGGASDSAASSMMVGTTIGHVAGPTIGSLVGSFLAGPAGVVIGTKIGSVVGPILGAALGWVSSKVFGGGDEYDAKSRANNLVGERFGKADEQLQLGKSFDDKLRGMHDAAAQIREADSVTAEAIDNGARDYENSVDNLQALYDSMAKMTKPEQLVHSDELAAATEAVKASYAQMTATAEMAENRLADLRAEKAQEEKRRDEQLKQAYIASITPPAEATKAIEDMQSELADLTSDVDDYGKKAAALARIPGMENFPELIAQAKEFAQSMRDATAGKEVKELQSQLDSLDMTESERRVVEFEHKFKGVSHSIAEQWGKLTDAIESKKIIIQLDKEAVQAGMTEIERQIDNWRRSGESASDIQQRSHLLIEKQLGEFKEAARRAGMTDREQRRDELVRGGADKAQLKQFDAAEQMKTHGESVLGTLNAVTAIKTPMEKYSETMANLNELLKAGRIDKEQFDRGSRQAAKERDQSAGVAEKLAPYMKFGSAEMLRQINGPGDVQHQMLTESKKQSEYLKQLAGRKVEHVGTAVKPAGDGFALHEVTPLIDSARRPAMASIDNVAPVVPSASGAKPAVVKAEAVVQRPQSAFDVMSESLGRGMSDLLTPARSTGLESPDLVPPAAAITSSVKPVAPIQAMKAGSNAGNNTGLSGLSTLISLLTRYLQHQAIFVPREI